MWTTNIAGTTEQLLCIQILFGVMQLPQQAARPVKATNSWLYIYSSLIIHQNSPIPKEYLWYWIVVTNEPHRDAVQEGGRQTRLVKEGLSLSDEKKEIIRSSLIFICYH